MTRATHHSLTCRMRQIYNMACPASPVHYQYNPVKTFKTSVIGTMNMLGLAKRVKARILQASTSEVYGDPEISPQTEDYWGHVNCNGVRSCYDEGKRSAETLCFDYHRQNNVDIRVARIFNTYGPGMHPYDGRVVSNFLVQAINGEDITVYGEGSQTRSFCFVDDLVDGLIRLMNQEETIGPVNIVTLPCKQGPCHRLRFGSREQGNPGEFTIKQLAELAIKTTGSKSKIIHLPLPGDDPKQRKPDITRVSSRSGIHRCCPAMCPRAEWPVSLTPALSQFALCNVSRPRSISAGNRRSRWRWGLYARLSTSVRSTLGAFASLPSTPRT